jgi:hypothetical protein
MMKENVTTIARALGGDPAALKDIDPVNVAR